MPALTLGAMKLKPTHPMTTGRTFDEILPLQDPQARLRTTQQPG